MWTLFWDMHSGGGSKEPPYAEIYIEAPIEEAKLIFFNRFGHNPERVSCTCCGEDYSISECSSLEQASAYHRGCEFYGPPRGRDGLYKAHNEEGRYFEQGEVVPDGFVTSGGSRNSYLTLDKYLDQPDVLVIHGVEVKREERQGTVPIEGYIWVG